MRLGNTITNPGELRTQITLKTRTVTKDAGGFPVPAGTTIAIVWSKWVNSHGRELMEGLINQVDMPATVLIRYRNDVDTACTISKGGLSYEILSVDNFRERNEYLELRVRRMKAG